MLTAKKLNPDRTHLDLETIRETLLYALSDTKNAPSLSGLTTAIQRTLDEIDAVQARPPIAATRRFRIVSFLPRTPAQTRPNGSCAPRNETGCADRSTLPSDDAAKQKLRSARVRTVYGDRAFLQQAITDFVKSRRG